MPDLRDPPRHPLLLPGLLLLTAAAYARGMLGGFVWDDALVLRDNPAVADLGNLWRFFADPHTGALSEAQRFYRPLRTALYALGHAVWGLEPLGYHALNVALHLANVCLLLSVLRRLGAREAVALVTAAVFALHPIMTEAVTNITGLTDVLFTFFYLLAWGAHLRGTGEGGRMATAAPLCWLAFAAALLSKEMAITLPPMVALADAVTGRLPPRGRRAAYAAHLLALLALAAGFVVLRTRLVGDLGQGADWPGGNAGRTWLMQAMGTVKYLQLIALPLGQSIRHTLAIPDGPWAFRPLASLLILASLAASGAQAWRRGRPTVALGVAWFFVTLAPAMNLIPIRGAMLGERFLYLPMAGLVLAAVDLLVDLPGSRRRRVAIAGAALLVLGALTVRRNAVWQSDQTAFEDALLVAPDSNAVRINLARVYRAQGRPDLAREQLMAGADNTRRNAARYNDLGDLEAASGDRREAAWWYRRALRMVPGDPRARMGLLRLRAAELDDRGGWERGPARGGPGSRATSP